jgi:hypothetical protein
MADVCFEKGQRALVGKCNMNRNAPDWYRDPSVSDCIGRSGCSRAMAPSPSSNSGSQHIAKRGVSIGFTRRDSGQRALVGKCNMNRNAPDWYRDPSVSDSLRETRELIQCKLPAHDGSRNMMRW